MGDLLGKGAAWLEDQRHKHLTRTVTYERGAETVELAATIGRSAFEEQDAHGILHRIEMRDFLVRAQDLVLGGAAIRPLAGDRIRESDGFRMYVYEVASPGGEPPFRYSDDYRRTLRIHTKLVDKADV